MSAATALAVRIVAEVHGYRPTIGVEPITPDLRPLLTDREYRATHAVVARPLGGPPTILATARDHRLLTAAAEQLARAHAAELVAYDPSLYRQPVVQSGDCALCAGRVEVDTAVVRGVPVPYMRHVVPAQRGDRSAHAAMVLGVAS